MEKAKVLVIDEISMLSAINLDNVDKILKRFKRNDLPFGGLQLILCGDFFQLPPVISAYEDIENKDPAWMADSWKKADLRICYLESRHRHKDDDFYKILSEIRAGEISLETRERVMKTCNKKAVNFESEITRLYTHNIDADKINENELKKLSGENKLFKMTFKGKKNLIDILKKSCLAPENLNLKIGARVMFVKNNFEAGYVNGTLGKVVKFSKMNGAPVIKTNDGRLIEASVDKWVIEEDGSIKAQISQYPLRLAWAITIHKSQGMTLDAVEIDLSKTFEAGMGYVALSRVKTLDNLFLLGINDKAFMVSESALYADEKFREVSKRDRELLSSIPKKEIKEAQKEFLAKVS